MKLIVWLWNPWIEYEKTRHNLGFLFLDWLVSLNKNNNLTNFKEEIKFKWFLSNWILNSEKIILLKPNTFMNLSWDSLRKIVDFYKIDVSDIIVIYDDMSMDFWKIRFRDSWSSWWHNWIKSIINHFWDNFSRIKVWIWLNSNFDVSDWVLSKFTKDELISLEIEIFPNVYNLLLEKL